MIMSNLSKDTQTNFLKDPQKNLSKHLPKISQNIFKKFLKFFFKIKLSNQFQNIFKKNHLKFYSKKLKIFTKIGGRTNFLSKMKKIKVALNCLKWRERFFDFLAPPKKLFGGHTKFFVKNEKKQSCSKLPKMARKLVEKDLWTI